MSDRRSPSMKEIAYITAFLLLAGTVYTMAKHPMQWDQNTTDIVDIKVKLNDHDKVLASLASDVADMKDDVHYIRRHTK